VISIVDRGQSIRKVKQQFQGSTKEFDVYRVPLSKLFYNDKNGRIATFINKYNAENPECNIEELQKKNLNEFNNIIAKYIKNANAEKTFTVTKKDIQIKGQQISGVVLSDGRVIDGNRRFTCLRELYSETGDLKYSFFETIIIDEPKTAADKVAIKTLELELQHGQDEKVEYTPIQRLVEVYDTLLRPNPLLSDQEYSFSANIDKRSLEKLKGKAQIMADFCEFYGFKEQFYVVDDLSLDGPIEEIWNLRKKYKNDLVGWNKVKALLFAQMIASGSGDLSRKVRDVIKIVKGNKDLIESTASQSKEIHDQMKEKRKESDLTGAIKELRSTVTAKSLNRDLEHAVLESKMKNIQNSPIDNCNASLESIKKVDINSIKHMKQEKRIEIKEIIDKIQKQIYRIGIAVDE
jgi:hypothetical protein